MVYFIADLNNEKVKIGFTKKDNGNHRLKQLQTSNANKLFIVGSVSGDMKKEKYLHKKFIQYKDNLNGEWFSLSDEIINYINDNSEMQYKLERIDGKLFPLNYMKLVK